MVATPLELLLYFGAIALSAAIVYGVHIDKVGAWISHNTFKTQKVISIKSIDRPIQAIPVTQTVRVKFGTKHY